MLNPQGKLNLGQYSDLYDLIVPKDNLFRRLKELCGDFEFIYTELKDKYCPDNGRTAIDPRVLFKYLLIKVIDNWSDADVVEHSRYDMSYKCFLGLPPEQSVMIDPSSLTVFRRRRLQDPDLMDKLMKAYPADDQLEWNRDNDNFEVLRRSDILISEVLNALTK